MIFSPTPLEGSYIVEPEPLNDERGWFVRYFCKHEFSKIGHAKEWVQMNHSFNEHAGTLRGMHYQKVPYKEIKLVRCIAGAVFDVIVDLRKGSSTFLRCFGIELSSGNKKMLYIPEGFAHGFQTLREDTELLYHHSAYYTPGSEAGIKYNDNRIKIEWPLPVNRISDRDKNYPDIDQNFKGI